MAAILKMTADKIGKISMFSDYNDNWYLGLFWSEGLIGNDENCIQGHFNDATVPKMAANKIDELLMVSDFNENWYQGVFWSEEFVGIDEICIRCHFYEATILKKAANKIVKLSMVSDLNENWYLVVFWSEELVGNDETCIHMPELWYGGRLGTSVYASKHNQTSLLHHPDCCRVMYCYSTFLFHYYYYYYYYYYSTHFCPLDFSEMPWSSFVKPCRNIICHVKLCW
jgi:hypothetical protein